MTSVTRTLNKMNGKQALPEDGTLQKQTGRYKSANTVFAKRAARGWLDCLRHSLLSNLPKACFEKEMPTKH